MGRYLDFVADPPAWVRLLPLPLLHIVYWHTSRLCCAAAATASKFSTIGCRLAIAERERTTPNLTGEAQPQRSPLGRAGERGTSSGGGGGRRSEGRCGLAQLHDRAPEERRPPQHRPLCARSALPAQPLAEEPDGCGCVCLGPPLPHLHRDWAHPCPICTGTGGGGFFGAHRISSAVDRLRRWAWRAS